MTLDELLAREESPVVSSEILRKAQEREREAREERAVVAAQNTLTQAQSTLEYEVNDLRQARKHERKLTENVRKLNRAVEYFRHSGNPLPFFAEADGVRGGWQARSFCNNLGIEVPNKDSDAWEVPADFQA